MKVQLKRAAHLGGHDYAKGVHELPDSLASHWFFLALQVDGHAVMLEEPKKIAIDPPMVEEAPPAAEEILEEDFRDEGDMAEEKVESVSPGKKKKRK